MPTPKAKRKPKSPTLQEIKKYVQTHMGDENNIGSTRLRKDLITISKLPFANMRDRALYKLLRETKIKDPNTGKTYVRHGPKGKSIVRSCAIKSIRTKLNNQTITDNRKSRILNSAFKRFGVKGAMTHFAKTKVPTMRLGVTGGFVRSGRLFNADAIREKLANITNGEVTLPPRTTTLGAGVAGMAVTCISNTKCRKEYKDLVLKVSSADKEWENEVKFLTKLTKYMKDNPKKDPLAPKIYGHFKIGNVGFILMQHAAKVFPKATVAREWRKYGFGGTGQKLTLLPYINKAMKRLHAVGIMHGNMHHGNVWVASIPVKGSTWLVNYKIYFADFGRSYNYNKIGTVANKGETWKYGNMMKNKIELLKHPVHGHGIMHDNHVMREYKQAAKAWGY